MGASGKQKRAQTNTAEEKRDGYQKYQNIH